MPKYRPSDQATALENNEQHYPKGFTVSPRGSSLAVGDRPTKKNLTLSFQAVKCGWGKRKVVL